MGYVNIAGPQLGREARGPMPQAHHAQRHHGRIFCFGFHPWKFGYVRRYLQGLGRPVVFTDSALIARMRGFDASSSIVVWGLRDSPAVQALSRQYDVPVWRMEDGFLRSVGLGSDRYAPASLVLDRAGIYYDPTRASELESILETASFASDELTRSRALRETIVALGVSKYNVGDRQARLPVVPDGKRVVLVPGQVEDDASIRLGCIDVGKNADLLRAVRAARPDAFIVFKPHPDVVSGNRTGAVPSHLARQLADAVVLDAPLSACLAMAHEVHTMTSLVGFEALLRGISVHVYGLPFYAGWGLTEDRHSCARRTRRLTLDELVAGVLLRYPLYLHPERAVLTTPEEVVEALRAQIARAGNRPVQLGWSRRKLQKLANAVRGVIDGF
jgi:capsular polysaccharide export protein